MDPVITTASIAQEIQLSVAPVFLLTGIAGVLAVLSGRLGRVIDRARSLQAAEADGGSSSRPPIDMSVVRRRIQMIQWAIRLYVVAALLICLVVVSLFVGDYVKPDLSLMISCLFVSAMVLMVVGLLLFLREVGLATSQTSAEITEMLKAGKR